MNSTDKLKFIKALSNDTDFARDVISILMPHMIHMISTDESKDDEGNLCGVELSFDDYESDTRCNYRTYFLEIEKIAHKVWGNLPKDNRNYPSRSEFVKAVADKVLENDSVFRASETVTEVEFRVRPNIEMLERLIESEHFKMLKARDFVRLLGSSIEKKTESRNEQGIAS